MRMLLEPKSGSKGVSLDVTKWIQCLELHNTPENKDQNIQYIRIARSQVVNHIVCLCDRFHP